MSDFWIRCYHCQSFKRAASQKIVTLKGCRNYKGDILLPSNLMEKDFCSEQCFWDYAREQLKDDTGKPPHEQE